METRGIRNQNPCNIRRGSSKWEGLRQEQTDPHYCQFTSMTYGLRAAFKLLQTYYNTHGCRTLTQIITRWAPPQDDNDTECYIRAVADFTGMGATQYLPSQRENLQLWKRIVWQMCHIESQYRPTWIELEAAYLLTNGI